MEILKKKGAVLKLSRIAMYTLSFTCITVCAHTTKLLAPPTFGKTHFIIGMPPQNTLYKIPSKQKKQTSCYAYFSPDDDLQKLLCECINNEKKGIDIAIFSFTNKHIAEALINAHKKGITIRIITDPSGAHDRFSKIHFLQEHGIPIYIYNTHYKKKGPATLSNIMHNKFVIFKKNCDNGPCVWTGSFNFTKSAALSNQENALMIHKKSIAKKYSNQFERLLTRCKRAL